MSKKNNIFSMSCVATVATIAYAYIGLSNIYRLMNPLSGIDLSVIPSYRMINPLWDAEHDQYQMKVYLSHSDKFSMDFLRADEVKENDQDSEIQTLDKTHAILLWNEENVGKSSPDETDEEDASLSKSFVITPISKESTAGQGQCLSQEHNSQCTNVKLGLPMARSWFDPPPSSFASTSIILTLFNSIKGSGSSSNNDSNSKQRDDKSSPEIIYVDENGPLWNALMNNNTIHAHVLLVRKNQKHSSKQLLPPSASIQERKEELANHARSHSVILGTVPLVKHDEPIPQKPTRILYYDISYFFQRYILRKTNVIAPWDLEVSQPSDYQDWQNALSDKHKSVGYPYFKPEVAVRLVAEDTKYPMDMASASGMEIVQIRSNALKKQHPSGYAYLPPLHVDEMGLTSEKYIPLNETVSAVPLRITLSTRQMGSAALTPQRWRLLNHLSEALISQKESGLFEESDIDDVKRLIADTNVTLLGITMLASILHLLFEFLTFKSDVEFWKNNTDLTGLSVRVLFLDVLCQIVVLAYLFEMDSSILMTAPAAIGILIAMWKCHRGAGLKFAKRSKSDSSTSNTNDKTPWYNRIISWTGFEIQATRMMRTKTKAGNKEQNKKDDLATLTDEMDRLATRKLGVILIPLVVSYAFYTLIVDEYSGWYSWFITTSSSAVYALGFALMTPQLFLNYKLKSVAHLPWRVLCYKFLNTFIDDLFAFIIRMPTMARISCFRDDVVFIVYLIQRYIYPVDTSRPVEGGGDRM